MSSESSSAQDSVLDGAERRGENGAGAAAAQRGEGVLSGKQFTSEKEPPMETSVILGRYTQQGAAKIKEGPARVEAIRKALEKVGGKMVAFYLTMGRYDFVVICETPNITAGVAVLLATGAQGNVSTETLRALTEAEFKSVVSSLP
jgi:uncharacterized protein with GYD domain